MTASRSCRRLLGPANSITARAYELLDDHEMVRRGLHELFEAEHDLEVVGEGSTAAEASPHPFGMTANCGA
jgi:hypothetical protein